MSVIACGFDPGWRRSALGVVQRSGSGFKLLHSQDIVTKPKQTQQECERVFFDALSGTLRAWKPMGLGIEDQAGVSAGARGALMAAAKSGKPMKKGSLGFNAGNDNVTGSVFIAKTACMAYGVDYEVFRIEAIKAAVCGKHGKKADKSEMIAAVRLLFPELADVPLSEHRADAIAIAVHMLRVLEQGVIVR